MKSSHFQGPTILKLPLSISASSRRARQHGSPHEGDLRGLDSMGAHIKETIKQFTIQRSCFQQQFLESPSPNCKSMWLCQKEISMQRNKCQDTSPGLPAEFTLPLLALSALSGPRPSSWHPADHSWAIIQKCSLVPRALSK